VSVLDFVYDPEDWLVSCTRALVSSIKWSLNDPNVIVESAFPTADDLLQWTPLAKPVIHVNRDDIENPVLGFGTPGVDEFVPGPGGVGGSWRLKEAQLHLVNFDVGVWVSAEQGGETRRMQLVQALTDMFSRPVAKKTMKEVTEGLWVESFTGGRDDVDRINDLPVWRAMEMTLILRVVSRHVPAIYQVVPENFDQDQDLTIADSDGNQLPI
jgi:hypothetical protein